MNNTRTNSMSVIDIKATSTQFHYAYLLSLFGLCLATPAMSKVLSKRQKTTTYQPVQTLNNFLVLTLIMDVLVSFQFPFYAFVSMWDVYSKEFYLNWYILIAKFLEAFIDASQAISCSMLIVFICCLRKNTYFEYVSELFSSWFRISLVYIPAIIPAIIVVSYGTNLAILHSYVYNGNNEVDKLQVIINCYELPRIVFGFLGVLIGFIIYAKTETNDDIVYKTTQHVNVLAFRFSLSFVVLLLVALIVVIVQRTSSPEDGKWAAGASAVIKICISFTHGFLVMTTNEKQAGSTVEDSYETVSKNTSKDNKVITVHQTNN